MVNRRFGTKVSATHRRGCGAEQLEAPGRTKFISGALMMMVVVVVCVCGRGGGALMMMMWVCLN